ncbi:MAG: hypothetical protein HKO68_11250 [Desulfobacterales bacterium]|nr:hypothetical protein [Desulfobacterales bacterium]
MEATGSSIYASTWLSLIAADGSGSTAWDRPILTKSRLALTPDKPS